jgi:hypothetical protein
MPIDSQEKKLSVLAIISGRIPGGIYPAKTGKITV